MPGATVASEFQHGRMLDLILLLTTRKMLRSTSESFLCLYWTSLRHHQRRPTCACV